MEHYEEIFGGGSTFDLIAFDHRGAPRWTKINQDSAAQLLECDPAELSISTLKQKHLLDEIDHLRNEIDPFINCPLPESLEVKKRRAAIEARMIDRNVIADMVERNAGEQDLLQVLKQDLSIFAEMYANPSKEYICFSEFPVANGFVDFAVFSGRSRMDVTLIEVKGADFNIITKGRYNKSFSYLICRFLYFA